MRAMNNYLCMLQNPSAYLYYKNIETTKKLPLKTHVNNFHPRQLTTENCLTHCNFGLKPIKV